MSKNLPNYGHLRHSHYVHKRFSSTKAISKIVYGKIFMTGYSVYYGYNIGDKNPPNAINNGCYVDTTTRDIIKIQKRF